MKQYKYLITAIVITCIAIAVRTVLLSIIPNGLHVDEIDAGYIGRYILEHGKDISGRVLPLYYDKIGDFRPTGIFYLSGLSVKLFGNSIAAIRLPGAILGSFSILSLMALSYLLFGNKLIALISGLFLAILPWHIVLSRATSEGIVGLFYLLTGISILIYGLKYNKIRIVFFGSIILGVSYFFYHPFRLLIPIILLPCIWYPKISQKMKQSIIGILCALFFLTVIFSLTKSGSGRFNQVAFYSNPSLQNVHDLMLASEGQNNIVRARIFHNKAVIIIREFISQYGSYFSLEYLFMHGGLPDRYRIPEQGLLYISFLPYIFIGIGSMIAAKNKWPLFFTMWLLMVAPLASALTYEDTPNTHRSLIMIIPIIILAGNGAINLYTLFSSKKIKITITILASLILFVEFSYFLHQYGIHAKSHIPLYRHDRYFDMAQYILSNNKSYDGIYIAGYEHFPLYVLFADGNFQKQQFSKDSNDVLIPQYKNIHFVHRWCPSKDMPKEVNLKNNLLIEQGDCESTNDYKEVSKWMRKDATTAFRILESMPNKQ